MKKAAILLVALFGIAGLSYFAFDFFDTTTQENIYQESSVEQIKADRLKEESMSVAVNIIPQGTMVFELYFSEFSGRMENLAVEVLITGNKIIIYDNNELPINNGAHIYEGFILKHKSGTWVIAQSESDRNAHEIGGCSDGPVPIDFETRVIEWC